MTEGVRVPDEIRERVAKALHSDGDRELDAEQGWCSKHDSMAQRFRDGSIGCHYLTIVERSSGGCTFTSHTDAVLAVLDRGALMAMLGAKQVGVLAHPGDRILDGPCPSPGCAHLAEAVYRIPSEDPQ